MTKEEFDQEWGDHIIRVHGKGPETTLAKMIVAVNKQIVEERYMNLSRNDFFLKCLEIEASTLEELS